MYLYYQLSSYFFNLDTTQMEKLPLEPKKEDTFQMSAPVPADDKTYFSPALWGRRPLSFHNMRGGKGERDR